MVCGFLIRREFGLTGGCCGLFSLLALLLYFVDIDILWLLSVDLVCGCCRCGLFICVWVLLLSFNSVGHRGGHCILLCGVVVLAVI